MARSVSFITTAAAVIMVFITAGNCWAKLIIARSSDHFLPAASLPALAITIAQGAEIVHLSLAMSADNQIIILGDTALNELTNVAALFPDRIRKDGSYQVMDFTLEELRQLSLVKAALKPDTDPSGLAPPPHIGISTLGEAFNLVKVMQHNLDRRVEIIAEIKKNWQYKHENRDISRVVIDVCRQHGYTAQDSRLTLASYDPEELQRIHEELFAESGVDLSLFQLIEDNSGEQVRRFERGRWLHYNYDWLYTKFGLKAVSAYADMISLKPDFLVSESGDLLHQEYIEDAHILGLKIIIAPVDHLAESPPPFSGSFESFIEFCLFTAGADGVISQKELSIRESIAKRSAEGSQGNKNKTTIELLLENIKRQQQNQ